jgi:hypothetical protein
LPEAEASFAPEAYVHSTLQAWGLRVPEVLYFEPYHALLQRSVMLTTAIAGQAIDSARPRQVRQIIREAGSELAWLNRLPVRGFGWVVRSSVAVDGLYGEYSTCQEWLIQHFEAPLHTFCQSRLLSPADSRAVQAALVEAIELFEAEPAVLAHGDFDTTHIYCQEGRYTGIIDFGEIRGTPWFYDIGHFWIENSDLLPPLLEGYAQAAAIPDDYERPISLAGLLIAARRLGRSLARQGDVYEPDVQAIQRGLAILKL